MSHWDMPHALLNKTNNLSPLHVWLTPHKAYCPFGTQKFLDIMILPLLVITYLTRKAFSQDLISPCPTIFEYEPRTEPDRWYGVIQAQTADTLTGVWLAIELDTKAELLGNWFGETFSSNNQDFRITNPDYILEAGPPVSVRFFIKYDREATIPRLKTIRLNGKTICSNKKEVKPTTPKLHISKPKPNRQPSEGGGLSYEPNNTSAIDDVTTINRPSTNYGNGNRPSSSLDAQRPSPSIDPLNSNREYGSDSNNPYNSGSSSGHNTFGRPSSSTINEASSDSYKPYNTGGSGIQDTFGRPSTSSSNNDYEYSKGNSGTTSSDYDYNRPNTKPNKNSIIYPDSDTSNGNKNSVHDSDEDFFQGDFNAQRPSVSERPRPKPLGQDTSNSVACGTVAYRPRPLITNGQDTVPGEWPWHGAIYHTKGIQLVYICGASLISDKFVLTAAHCVTRPRSNKMVEAESILIYFGKYNLKTFGPETQDRDVAEIYIHPEFNNTMFYNDIAILKLNKAVEINENVRPCCLWEEDTSLESVVDKQGTVVGWGFDENKKISEKLMQAKMPIVSTIKCIYSNRDFFSRFTNDKNFCAGFLNGSSVCNGDSGGSMVFPKRGTSGQSTVWQIRGIVSVGVALQSEGVCDTSQYVIFTDVAKYTTWIRQIMRS